MKEVAEHANIEHAVKMVVANKIDRDSEREVSRKEGAAFANSQKCLFVETSAKANTAVTQVWDKKLGIAHTGRTQVALTESSTVHFPMQGTAGAV